MEKKSKNTILKIILSLLIIGAVLTIIIIFLNKNSNEPEQIQDQIIEIQTKEITINGEEKNKISNHNSSQKIMLKYDKDNLEEINLNIYYLYNTLEAKTENLPIIKEEYGDSITRIELHEEDPENKIIFIEISEEKTKEILGLNTKSDIDKFIKEQEKQLEEL